MSTLSKLFVVMILVLALILLGVNATLFAMRADFKHKFVEETRHHYQSLQIKNAELADSGTRNQLLADANTALKRDNEQLTVEINSVKAQNAAHVTELANKQNEIDKLVAGVNTYGRQLEVQLQQVSDALARVEEYKKRAAEAFNKAAMADQDRLYRIQEAERLSKDLGSLENQYQELARDRQRLQETIAALSQSGVPVDKVAPRKALAGQVNAVAGELDLVVISIGRDAGVNEGDDFTVYRGSTFVGKVTIDRVDRAWASGRVTLKGKEEPRVGDSVSNNVLATPGKSGN